MLLDVIDWFYKNKIHRIRFVHFAASFFFEIYCCHKCQIKDEKMKLTVLRTHHILNLKRKIF